MKKLISTASSLTQGVSVAQRIAFLRGQEELLRIDHDSLHQQIVDVHEALRTPPAVLAHMVGLQSAVFEIEAEIREVRQSLRTSLLRAYKESGAQYAHFYVKEILSAPVNETLELVQKRSGKHKTSTEDAVKTILKSTWWQEYVDQENSLLSARSRAETSISEIQEAHDEASVRYCARQAQESSLRRMEHSLEAQMLETAIDLLKWVALDSAGLEVVALPTVQEKPAIGLPGEEIWSAHGTTNAYLWSQTDNRLLAVTELEDVSGNERNGIRFITKEGDHAWTVRYANYRRTPSYPKVELVVVPRPAPDGAKIISTAQLVTVMDTSG